MCSVWFLVFRFYSVRNLGFSEYKKTFKPFLNINTKGLAIGLYFYASLLCTYFASRYLTFSSLLQLQSLTPFLNLLSSRFWTKKYAYRDILSVFLMILSCLLMIQKPFYWNLYGLCWGLLSLFGFSFTLLRVKKITTLYKASEELSFITFPILFVSFYKNFFLLYSIIT